MKPGRYMAFRPIPLARPFASDEIPSAVTFDVLAEREAEGLVLVRFDGIRVWKSSAHFDGRATFWRDLPAEQISTTAIVTRPSIPSIEAEGLQLSAFERYAMQITGSQVSHGC